MGTRERITPGVVLTQGGLSYPSRFAFGHSTLSGYDRGELGLTKSEFVRQAVKVLLNDHCASNMAIEQAATLLADVHDMDVEHLTDVVEAASPSKWPAKPIAQMVLVILEKTLGLYQEGDAPDSWYEDACNLAVIY